MDAHLPRPGWSREDLGLPMGQGTLTALSTRKGGGGGKREDLALPTGQGTLTALWTGEGGRWEMEEGWI